MNTDSRMKCSVIVIGAGSAGLAAARAVRNAGFRVRILDKASRIGEPWRARHPQLRLNTHRSISSLPGMAMPGSDGAFLERDTVVRYLEDYARRLDVPVDFGVAVERLEPGDGQWRVITGGRDYAADHVVIATGPDRVPYTPDWAGIDSFRGRVVHAAAFGRAAEYRGQRVLVVGAGNSGTDVLNHLAGIGTGRVWVSVRHGPVIFPMRLYGLPVQLLSPLLEKLPVPAVDRMLALTERIAFGDLSRWGMRKHPDGGATRLMRDGVAPAIDNGFVEALKAGRVEVVPEVSRFEAAGVRLDDGRHVEPDVVICATGYRPGLEGMLGHLDLLDRRGAPVIHGAEQHQRCPGIWFTGMRPMLSGYFRAAGPTGEAIARAIRMSDPIRRAMSA